MKHCVVPRGKMAVPKRISIIAELNSLPAFAIDK